MRFPNHDVSENREERRGWQGGRETAQLFFFGILHAYNDDCLTITCRNK